VVGCLLAKSGSALILSSGLLVAGRFADLYGRKYLFLIGLSTMCIFSLISGFLRVRIALCIVRAFAGLGAAIAMPAAFGIVATTFPDDPERTIAFAVMGVGFPLGGGGGQVIGGLVASTGRQVGLSSSRIWLTPTRHGWQYQFFILAGLAFLAVILGALVIPQEPPKMNTKDRRVDWLGAGIIPLALSLFSFSITQGGLVTGGWHNACEFLGQGYDDSRYPRCIYYFTSPHHYLWLLGKLTSSITPCYHLSLILVSSAGTKGR